MNNPNIPSHPPHLSYVENSWERKFKDDYNLILTYSNACSYSLFLFQALPSQIFLFLSHFALFLTLPACTGSLLSGIDSYLSFFLYPFYLPMVGMELVGGGGWLGKD